MCAAAKPFNSITRPPVRSRTVPTKSHLTMGLLMESWQKTSLKRRPIYMPGFGTGKWIKGVGGEQTHAYLSICCKSMERVERWVRNRRRTRDKWSVWALRDARAEAKYVKQGETNGEAHIRSIMPVSGSQRGGILRCLHFAARKWHHFTGARTRSLARPILHHGRGVRRQGRGL